MPDTAATWSDVGSRFSALGQNLRTHFDQARTAKPADSSPADTTVGDADPGDTTEADAAATAADNDRVREALRKFGDALDGVIDAVGSAVKDPAVKADVKQVGSALSNALSSSFAEVSDDLRKAFRRATHHAGEGPPAPADPPSPTSVNEPPGKA